MKPGNVVVIGSINMDLVVKTGRFPRPGETMPGESFYTSYGGKGANQAVTIARLGAPSALIGCVGGDAFGEEMVSHLREEGIDTSGLRKAENCSSGTAVIIVDSDGRNQIIVVRGANERLCPDDIRRAEQLIASAKLVVLQLEIPLDAVCHAVETAHKHGVDIILNPAPAPAEPLHSDLLKQVSVLVPNEVEAEALTGLDVDSPDFARSAIHALKEKAADKVIVTLAEKGCILSESDKEIHVPAYSVKAEDSTGAGDAFVGALAAGYSSFRRFADLVKFASAVAAISVTKRGAQSSLPHRQEVRAFLETHEPSLLNDFSAMERERKQ